MQRSESRLPPAAMVGTLVVILVAVPRHYRLLAPGSEVVIGGLLIVFLWTRFAGYAIAVFSMVVATIEITILVRLLYEMANTLSNLEPIVLLWTAVDLWLTNVVLFTLIYWQLDRGGPDGRAGTAFSPSQIYPLSDRGKLLHIAQSLISLLIIVALAAKAIDVLGK